MKKKMTVALVSILAFGVLVFTVGLLLPKEKEYVKKHEFKSSPELVFQLVTDVERQVEWRSDVREVKVIDEDTWTEIPQKGTPITFKTKQKIENQLFEIEIVAPKSFKGYWVGTFEKTETGTKVVFKEVVIIKNSFFRVLSLIFVDLDKTMEVYMNNLKTKLGE